MKTLLFVDDDPKVLQGLHRQLRTMRHEWVMEFVESGPNALAFMATHPVDVIVTDMMMPGMDGAQLLTEVSQRHPNTIRMVLSGHADRESILRLVGPAHQYLSKPCESEELRQAISRAFGLRQLLTSERLKQLAARIKSLPSLPAVYTQLTEELRREEPSLERIGGIICRDPGMTAKILQLVNSAFFGLPQPISHPQEAVMYLGLATVRSLVLALQIFSQFPEGTLPEFSLQALAQHGWLTGVLARRIAKAEQQEEKTVDQCFLAGLLHDLGRLVLAGGLPQEYAAVVRQARHQPVTLWEAEQTGLGASHAEIGAYLLGLWGLPDALLEAVAFHHRPLHSGALGFSPALAVYVADVFAHHLTTSSGRDWPPELDRAGLAQAGLADRIEVWKDVCLETGLN